VQINEEHTSISAEKCGSTIKIGLKTGFVPISNMEADTGVSIIRDWLKGRLLLIIPV
jgi:hypothetical protein